MAVDRIKPLKLESPESGGIETDDFPTSLDANEDFVDCRGVAIQNDTSDNEAVLISRDSSDNMTFKDGANTTKTLSEIQAPGGAHKTTHENGGGDEISVAGLSGALADAQTPTAHAASHQNGGADEVATATPAANAIPKADVSSKLDGWVTANAVAGTASLRQLGSGATDACAGNDARLSDARTPTAHVSSHHSGGGDALAHQSIAGAGTNAHSTIDTHLASTSNPHSVTKAQVGLTSVTDDAQLKRADNDFGGFTLKGTPASDDVLLIEDSAASWAKKKATVGSIGGGGGGDWDGVQVYYVGKHGSDSNDGKCDKLAFLTVAAAITAVNAQTPGPTNLFVIRIVDAGIYAEGGITIPTYTMLDGPAATIRGDITCSHISHVRLHRLVYVYRAGYIRALYFNGAASAVASAEINFIDNDQADSNPYGFFLEGGIFYLIVKEIRSTHASTNFSRGVRISCGLTVDCTAYVRANKIIAGAGDGIRVSSSGAGGASATCIITADYIYGSAYGMHVYSEKAAICAHVGQVVGGTNALFFTNSNAGPIVTSMCQMTGGVGTSSATPWVVVNTCCGSDAGVAIFATTSTSPQDVISVSARLAAGTYIINSGGYCYNDTANRGWRVEIHNGTSVLQVAQLNAMVNVGDRFSAALQYRLTVATATTYTFKLRFNRLGASGTANLVDSSLCIRRAAA